MQIAFRPITSTMQTSAHLQQRLSQTRFGFCPLCVVVATGIAGLYAAGTAGAKLIQNLKAKNQKEEPHSLTTLFGDTLSDKLLAELERVAQSQPQLLDQFTQNPQQHGRALMDTIDPNLRAELLQILEQKRAANRALTGV